MIAKPASKKSGSAKQTRYRDHKSAMGRVARRAGRKCSRASRAPRRENRQSHSVNLWGGSLLISNGFSRRLSETSAVILLDKPQKTLQLLAKSSHKSQCGLVVPRPM